MILFLHEFYFWCIKKVVKRNCKLNHAEIGSKMAAVFRNSLYQLMTDFFAECSQFFGVQWTLG